jgi:hypothetical protein
VTHCVRLSLTREAAAVLLLLLLLLLLEHAGFENKGFCEDAALCKLRCRQVIALTAACVAARFLLAGAWALRGRGLLRGVCQAPR